MNRPFFGRPGLSALRWSAFFMGRLQSSHRRMTPPRNRRASARPAGNVPRAMRQRVRPRRLRSVKTATPRSCSACLWGRTCCRCVVSVQTGIARSGVRPCRLVAEARTEAGCRNVNWSEWSSICRIRLKEEKYAHRIAATCRPQAKGHYRRHRNIFPRLINHEGMIKESGSPCHSESSMRS